jgi:hypothetical protein
MREWGLILFDELMFCELDSSRGGWSCSCEDLRTGVIIVRTGLFL